MANTLIQDQLAQPTNQIDLQEKFRGRNTSSMKRRGHLTSVKYCRMPVTAIPKNAAATLVAPNTRTTQPIRITNIPVK